MKAESMRELSEILYLANTHFIDIKNIIMANIDASEEDIEKIICELRLASASPLKISLIAQVFRQFNLAKYRTIDERLEIVEFLYNYAKDYYIDLLFYFNAEILLINLSNQDLINMAQKIIDSNYPYNRVQTILLCLYSVCSISANDAWNFVEKVIKEYNYNTQVIGTLLSIKEEGLTISAEQIYKKLEEAYLKAQKESIQEFTKSFKNFNSYDEFANSLKEVQELNNGINITGEILGLNTEDEEPDMPSSGRK